MDPSSGVEEVKWKESLELEQKIFEALPACLTSLISTIGLPSSKALSSEVQRWFMDNGDSISIEGSRLKTISRELEANLESGGRVAVSSQRDLGLAILLLHLQRESDLQLVYFGSLDDRDLDAAELQLTKEVAVFEAKKLSLERSKDSEELRRAQLEKNQQLQVSVHSLQRQLASLFFIVKTLAESTEKTDKKFKEWVRNNGPLLQE